MQSVRYPLLFLGLIFFSQTFAQAPTFEFLWPNPSKTWPFIFSINIDNANNLWAGIEDGSLYRYKDLSWSEMGLKAKNASDVRDIAFDSKNQPWVATNGSGIFKRDSLGTWVKFNSSNMPVTENQFTNVEVDSNDNIWATSKFAPVGLLKFNGTSWTNYTMSNSPLTSNYLDGLVVDPDGSTIWTSDGPIVFKFSNGIWTKYDLKKLFTGLSSLYDNDLFTQKDGSIQCATSLGIFSYSNGVWTDMRPIFGEFHASFIHADQPDKAWYGETFFGMHYYNGQSITDFPDSDTIPSQPFAFVQDKDGFKYFTGNIGSKVVKMDDSGLSTNIVVPTSVKSGTFTLAPIPAQNEIYIKDESSQCGNCEINIIDLFGQLRISQEWSSQIQVASLEAGLYILFIKKGNEIISSNRICIIR